MKRRKLWLGLSTAILAVPSAAGAGTPATHGTGSPIMLAQAHGERGHGEKGHGERGAATTKAKPASSGEGGEGGEGGERGAAATLPADLRLARGIGLIRGHLLVGDELVQAGRWADALPHFLHPSEEIYGGIRGDLKTFSVAPFDAALKALAQTVKAKNKDAYARARATLEERLAAADKAVMGKQQNPVYFTLETALEVLKSAADEYEEAVKGGRIANVVEYQDSRGFVMEVDRMVGATANELSAKDAEAAKAIRAALDSLKQAWPEVQPPKAPVKEPSAILADISRIELQLNNFR